jgi:hypothetical protein
VRVNYQSNKVIAFDETGGSDCSDRKYRTEGWAFIMAGGGVYDHLDFSFTTERPDGTAVPLAAGTPGGGGPELRRQLGVLKSFIEGFDYIRMKPADHVIKTNYFVEEPEGVRSVRPSVSALAEIGKAYAIYINGGTRATLEMELPANDYKAEWVNTKTGRVEQADVFTQPGGNRSMISPRYSEDIALRVIRQVD